MLSLVSLTLSYPEFSLTFHLVPLLLISMASNLLPLNFSTVFLKVLFLVLYSSILYTTPLSSIISQSSVNHKLYAYDTQLFLSFSADTFSENILLLQNTISNISSWMASNFLSLNPAKTEFLLIGLPAQLSKFTIPHLHFLQIQYKLFLLLEILVLSLILIFLFLIISHTFRNPASLIFVICDVFVIL